jgi:hypothetical protein
MAIGTNGLSYLKSGYRVQVRGRGTENDQIEAQLVQVNFPPITGTILSLSHSKLDVKVPGQPAPAPVQLTSHTAFFVPDGDTQRLAAGAPVRVWVVPTAHDQLSAVTVMVLNNTPAHSPS